jgi:hypothetical protein
MGKACVGARALMARQEDREQAFRGQALAVITAHSQENSYFESIAL